MVDGQLPNIYVADFESNVPDTELYGSVEVESETHESILFDRDVVPSLGDPYGIEHAEELWDTRVWGWAICPSMETPTQDDVRVGGDMYSFIYEAMRLPNNSTVYFHNLAFDVSFFITVLFHMGYKLTDNGKKATEWELDELQLLEHSIPEDIEHPEYQEAADAYEKQRDFLEKREKSGWRKPPPKTMSAVVSDDGTWYKMSVTFGERRNTIHFQDSLKIIPFPVDSISHLMKTKAKKLKGSIDYTKDRPVGYEMTDTEKRYIENDVLVMSEAIYKVNEADSNLLSSLTIGGACMKDLFRVWGGGDHKKGKRVYRSIMPVVDVEQDAVWRKSYKGGWCINYTDGNIVGALDGVKRGHTMDVNSLYPSVMRGRRYPVGEATYHEPENFNKVLAAGKEYIVRFSAEYGVKDNHVPFVQDAVSRWGDQAHIYNSEGVREHTMCRPEYELFLEQYDVLQLDVLDVWTWESSSDVFDEYIDKWYGVRLDAKARKDKVMDTVAKLMLNNPYGKMSQAPERLSGIPYIDEEGVLKYEVEESVTDGGFIPIGSYITAYARCVTIRAAQALINSGRTFLYADTDSVHFLGSLDGIDSILDIGKQLGQWDHEASWDMARFVRQKTYIENLVEQDGEDLETPHLDIKAAGAPESVKTRLRYNVTDLSKLPDDGTHYKDLPDHQKPFEPLEFDEDDQIISEPRPTLEIIERFQPGLVEAGKLRRKNVPGGVILEETTFKIHKPK